MLRIIDWPVLCSVLEKLTTAVKKGMQHVRMGVARIWVQSGLPPHSMPPSLSKAAGGLPRVTLGHPHGADSGKQVGPSGASDDNDVFYEVA
jgi:hypothetical protein